jgi:glutathione S-transferase
MKVTTRSTKTTLWIWPTGLFPRRLLYYFRAKHMTLTALKDHNIDLIPVTLSTSPLALESVPGHEARPKDTSLPVMRIVHADGREVWIRESLSILEYLEDLRPSPSLLGESAGEKAQTRDIVSLLNDAMHWGLIHLIHSDSKTTFWSGLNEDEMSKSTAEHAKGKFEFYLQRLEAWIKDGGGAIVRRTTIAGMVLLAQVEYHEMIYGADWIKGHTVLREWVGRMKEEEWYVESGVLKGVEEGKGWETILGE